MRAIHVPWVAVLLASPVYAEPFLEPHGDVGGAPAGGGIPFSVGPARPILPDAGAMLMSAVQAAQMGDKKAAKRLSKASEALDPKLKSAVCGGGDSGGGGDGKEGGGGDSK